MKTIQNRWIRSGVSALAGLGMAFGAAQAVRGQGQANIRDTDDGIKYARGQNVVPVYEGWVVNPDGTHSLIFGYWNRNWEEELMIPIGPNNHFEPGAADQGQPTYFGPRRGKSLFEVVVPKDFGKKEVVWTITSRGRTEKAYGALVPQEVLTRRMVLAGGSLNAAAAAGSDDNGDEGDPNKPPTLMLNTVPPTTVAGTATVEATVTDDGLFIGRGRGNRSLRVNWVTYRGPARITFGPALDNLPSPTGGKVTTTAKFSMPGIYVVRATATDAGGLAVNKDVTVEVK